MDTVFIKSKKTKGYTLLEMLLVLIVISILMGYYALQAQNVVENSTAEKAGLEMKTYRSAVEAYIIDHFGTLVTLPQWTITTADLITDSKLPVGHGTQNVFGSTYTTIITVSGVYPFYDIQGLTTTVNPWIDSGGAVRMDFLGLAARTVGTDGGYSNSATVAAGVDANWTATNGQFPNITARGQLCARVGYNSSNVAQFYRRSGELPLTGNMNANNQEILNIQRAQTGYLDLTNIQAIGSPCTTAGRLARDNTGSAIYCDGTVWKQIGVVSGTITMWPLPITPQGWLECNGQEVSRITYNTLFANIGVTYGAGNGSTTFNLPDYRGAFLRGWDNGAGRDPDSAVRTNRGDGVTGDQVGTRQDDALRDHRHTIWQSVQYGGGGLGAAHSGPGPGRTGYVADGLDGNETRPLNVNIVFIIKT